MNGLLSSNRADSSTNKSKSPQRLGTDPTGKAIERVRKRIIICCDGTWQDGISENRHKYTNALRLARTIEQEDIRTTPPTPQVVYYQSGIGSEKNFYSEFIEGTTGDTLADKVEEAYAFIAHNYFPGDEIFLFGFSRGAYTARMVALLIGKIGVLDRKNMDDFGTIFLSYQILGNAEDEEAKAKAKADLERLEDKISSGVRRAFKDDRPFSIKCVGVFDTVGSLGLPEELTLHPGPVKTLFGFPDRILGEHVERAYQALALNEPRKDFNCSRFEQTSKGRCKHQVLKQCWFTGSHADIGGGYYNHDLADLTLAWMVAHVSDILSTDLSYLACLSHPVAPWGAQEPHDPLTGIFSLSLTTERTLPTSSNNVTHESIHPSVLQQQKLNPAIQSLIEKHPELVCSLLPLEEELRAEWPYKPEEADIKDDKNDSKANGMVASLMKTLVTTMMAEM
ncbi:hypothetical protein E1B28_000981 [Marasmius oreades]|uniref:T6SS Phospholipase effector Tle1-like catalytic domain-containing protein n=1 Tax=Marasmius oreades TaxID=181124 RepID=A0A9P7V2L8_9AGAR|nr:uncharacterized protein E1B28_000981 [Marasmius oreades]KAG7099108.1 hypothetical protein E1B28_000981 [Marasmius oreades]